MRSMLFPTLARSTAVAMLAVSLTGCMTSNAKTPTAKSDEKCDQDCCADNGKAVVVNQPKSTMGQPATQPSSAAPATRPSN